jgi:hypothetical protein
MSLATIILACMALLIIAYVLWRLLKSTEPSEPPSIREPTRCGTPYLQMGGTLYAMTGNTVEVITRDSVETITLDEYNALKLKQLL